MSENLDCEQKSVCCDVMQKREEKLKNKKKSIEIEMRLNRLSERG